MSSPALLACWAGAALVTGCPVDDRTLYSLNVVIIAGAGDGSEAGSAGDDAGGAAGAPTTGGTAGTGGTGKAGSSTAGTGAGGNASVAGAGGGGSSGEGGEMPCPDLDDNDVLDCDETLAKNASFDADAASWTAETGIELAWNEIDAHGKDDSGSLELENRNVVQQDGLTMLGARQCFAITGGTVYRIGAEVSVSEEAKDRQGGLQLIVHEGAACSGDVLHIVNANRVTSAAWSVTEITYLTPIAAQSVALRLVSLKAFRDAPFSVRVDNVLMKEE